MNSKSLVLAALAIAITAGTGDALAQYGAGPQQSFGRIATVAQAQYRDDDDDHGDREFREHERFRERGFRDGFEGARKDFENHRFFTPMNRDEYRDPDDVPRDAIRIYRIAFREGYLRGEHEIEEQAEGR